MSKKTKKTEISGQVNIKNPRTTRYGNIAHAIKEVINLELTEPQQPTRLSDIKLTGLKSVIGKITLSEFNGINPDKIVTTLKANAKTIKQFIESHGNYYLSHIKTYQAPILEAVDGKLKWVNEDDYKTLMGYFEQSSETIRLTADDMAKQQEAYKRRERLNKEWQKREPNAKYLNPKPSKVGDTLTISGYKIVDYDGLVKAIKETVQQSNRHSIYDPTQDPNADFEQLDPILIEFSKLAKEVGIKPSGNLVARETKNIKTGSRQVVYGAEYTEPSTDPNIITTDIRVSDQMVYIYVLYAIVDIKDKHEQDLKNRRKIVNIYNAENHDVIMQPHTMSLTDMIDGAFEGREAKRLFNDWSKNGYRRQGYGSPKAIKKDGGWLAHIDTVQSELPIAFDENDRKTLIKFMVQVKALVIDVTTALRRYLRDNPDHDPDEYISLVSLARYIKPNDSKLKKGELRPDLKQKILNGLTMAQLISGDYKVGKDKRGNKEWQKIYVINRITNYKTYGNTDIVTGVKVDFTKEYKESGGLNRGVIYDGLLLLSTPEHKVLGAYILERFAQYQDATRQGDYQKITADTLIQKAGLVDDTKTNKLSTLQKALNTLVDNGIIAKWACKNGAKNIRGYDKESQTILIYPTQNLIDSYAPSLQDERKAIKLEQKNRLKALKKWFSAYTKRETASEILGVSVAELNALLAGSKIINDDILDIIKEEL